MNIFISKNLINELIQFRKISAPVYDKFCTPDYNEKTVDFSKDEISCIIDAVRSIFDSLCDRWELNYYYDKVFKETKLFFVKNKIAKSVSIEQLKNSIKYSKEDGQYILPIHFKYKGKIYILRD